MNIRKLKENIYIYKIIKKIIITKNIKITENKKSKNKKIEI